LVEDTNKIFSVNPSKLEENYNVYVNNFANININENITINRFSESLTDNKFELVYQDYSTFNNEMYLKSITKAPITIEQKNLLLDLKEEYKLPSKIINMIIDFSLSKTLSFNSQYIKKVAYTFNLKGINTISEASQ
jgi:replication initiation and membrane attachment protein DnaB